MIRIIQKGKAAEPHTLQTLVHDTIFITIQQKPKMEFYLNSTFFFFFFSCMNVIFLSKPWYVVLKAREVGPIAIWVPLLVSPSSLVKLTLTGAWAWPPPPLELLLLRLRIAKMSTTMRMRRYTICPATSSCNSNFSSLCIQKEIVSNKAGKIKI